MRALIGSMLLIVVAALPDGAYACSCIESGPPCQNYFRDDAVFVGTVRTISTVEGTGAESQFRRRRVILTVDRAFRGVQGGIVDVRTGMGGGDCGYAFKPGERYLVYARREPGISQLVTGICSRTRPLAEASEDLKYIEQLPASASGARVSGVVKHWERDLASGNTHEYGPVASAHVLLQSPSVTLDAQTDDDGRYEITGAPAGAYEVRVIPPPAFSTKYLEQKIELRDVRACAVVNFAVHFDGRVSGLVLGSDGLPAIDVPLELTAPERLGGRRPVETIRTNTDQGGNFEFTEVPPGEYVLGVHTNRRIESGVVYPPTYHPGTATLAKATIIAVGEGNRQEVPPMKLPPPRQPREITGVVLLPDGRPVAGASVWLSDGDAAWRQVAVGLTTDADGRFTFVVYEGSSYIARAAYDVPDDPRHRQLQGTSRPFVVRGTLEPLRIMLAGLAR